ncbi:MAG: HAMP domain-containing histidine kinase [Ruminococcus sp.]|nr:HAMP domain-containing histidine kinase [Ruminococcus sp.]
MNKNKRSKCVRYRSMIFRLSIAFFATIIILSFFLAVIMIVLRKMGINITSRAVPAVASFMLYFICFIIASAISYLGGWYIFSPIKEVSEAAKKIADGDYSVRINNNSRVIEVSETIESFNHMAEELGSVEMMRNDFIANVSHEFKTPLSALSGYVTILQDSSLSDEERREYSSKAFLSIEKLSDLTDNILRLTKLEHQYSLDSPVSYRLDEQLRETIVLLEPKWSRKNISFDLDLPEINYTGQKALLFQVWTNLISNAIKFSSDNSSIAVKLEESPHHYKIYVSDYGIGMSEEQIRHIFDKFYQADNSRQAQGNGLGLSICKEIVSRCSGKIYVTSKPDEGSVFLVSLKKEI